MTTNDNSVAEASVRAAGPGIVLLARVGYAAKGLVYIVIGWLAARAGLGVGGKATDSKGALQVMGDGPAGAFVLIAIGLGLIGYMVWRLVAAVTDAEGKGNEPTRLVVRASQAARGLLYGALGVQALRALGGRSRGSGDASARDWTARLMEMPFGRTLVFLAGVGIIGYAGYQLYRSRTSAVRKHLDLAKAGPSAARWILRLGSVGIAARGVVFGVIGVFLIKAARQYDPSEAGGIARSLATLAQAPYGRVVLAVVAIGLMAYGAYQIATARYRHMRAVG